MVIAGSTVSHRAETKWGRHPKPEFSWRVHLYLCSSTNRQIACYEDDVVCGIYINGIKLVLFSLGT
jgi:hypothetical protein